MLGVYIAPKDLRYLTFMVPQTMVGYRADEQNMVQIKGWPLEEKRSSKKRREEGKSISIEHVLQHSDEYSDESCAKDGGACCLDRGSSTWELDGLAGVRPRDTAVNRYARND